MNALLVALTMPIHLTPLRLQLQAMTAV